MDVANDTLARMRKHCSVNIKSSRIAPINSQMPFVRRQYAEGLSEALSTTKQADALQHPLLPLILATSKVKTRRHTNPA
jgi:hypothetical protein